jgi:hypothetical protein
MLDPGPLLTVARSLLEYEVARRIAAHPRGRPGIDAGPATGDGRHEIVLRDEIGIPIGVMGFTGPLITDYAVLPCMRRLGVARRMYQFLAEAGIREIRGPFTAEGLAFARAMLGAAEKVRS